MQRVYRGLPRGFGITDHFPLWCVARSVVVKNVFARWSLTHRKRDGQICKSKLPLPKDLQEAISRLTYRSSEGSLHGVLAAFDKGHPPQSPVENIVLTFADFIFLGGVLRPHSTVTLQNSHCCRCATLSLELHRLIKVLQLSSLFWTNAEPHIS